MKKLIVFTALLFALPSFTFAFTANSTVIDSVTFNGGSTATVEPGADVEVEVTVTISGDDWESTRWDIIPDGASAVCENTSDSTSNGQHTKSFTISAPDSDGSYDVEIKIYGYSGGPDNDNCSGSFGNPNASQTFDDAIVVETPEEVVLGCIDPEADNYNSEATEGNEDAEDCEYPQEEPILGCTDSEALNYDEEATEDDDSCEYEEEQSESDPEPESTGGGSSSDEPVSNPGGQFKRGGGGQVLGAYISNTGDWTELEALKAQLLSVLQQLLALVQAELEAQQSQL